MADQRPARLEKTVEGLQQLAPGGLDLTREKALDHGQREALLLELLDPLQPLDVALAVPGHAALSPRGVEEALALVEADRVDGDAGGPRQLFDPVLHEYLL